MNQGRE